MVERGRDPVAIFEKALAVGLDEIAEIRCRVDTCLEDHKRIDPASSDVNSNAVAADLDEAGNVTVDSGVELRECLAQAHSGLGIRRTVPKQPHETAPGYAIALRKTQARQDPAGLSPSRQDIAPHPRGNESPPLLPKTTTSRV